MQKIGLTSPLLSIANLRLEKIARANFFMPLCDDNSYHIYMLEKEIIFFTFVYISCYNILPNINKCNLNHSGHLIKKNVNTINDP